MVLSQSDLKEGFKSLGLVNGDTVLVHSSLKSFGYVLGGAYAVIDALSEAVGPHGTILVPTLTGKPTDGPDNLPVFDVRHSKSWTGKIAETLRLMPSARRSLHPTHSVSAIGYRRDEIATGHELSESPCDKHSPYYKNASLGGYILLIGVDQESNTSIHCFEEIASVPYHLQNIVTNVEITGYKGEKILVGNRLHDWNKPPTDFNKFENVLSEKEIQKTGKIGNSTIRLINAADMFYAAIDILKKNPLFLLKDGSNLVD